MLTEKELKPYLPQIRPIGEISRKNGLKKTARWLMSGNDHLTKEIQTEEDGKLRIFQRCVEETKKLDRQLDAHRRHQSAYTSLPNNSVNRMLVHATQLMQGITDFHYFSKQSLTLDQLPEKIQTADVYKAYQTISDWRDHLFYTEFEDLGLSLIFPVEHIVLEEVPIGSVLVIVPMNPAKAIMAKATFTEWCKDGHFHPHISNCGTICLGGYHQDVQKMRRELRFYELVATCTVLLNTYNASSPFKELHDTDAWCHSCEDYYLEEHTFYCDLCGNIYCDDCTLYCAECSNWVCVCSAVQLDNKDFCVSCHEDVSEKQRAETAEKTKEETVS